MEQMREILRRIHDGETNFEPTDDSHEALRDFQPLARRIVSAHKRDFLTRALFHRNYEHGCDYIDCIMVGGLTFEGERFLSNPPEQARAPADLIKFEPRIFWFKLEGNEIFRRLKRWWKDKVKKQK